MADTMVRESELAAHIAETKADYDDCVRSEWWAEAARAAALLEKMDDMLRRVRARDANPDYCLNRLGVTCLRDARGVYHCRENHDHSEDV